MNKDFGLGSQEVTININVVMFRPTSMPRVFSTCRRFCDKILSLKDVLRRTLSLHKIDRIVVST